MTSILLDQKSRVNLCFSITLAALLFRGAGRARGTCETSDLVSYMKVCNDPQWAVRVMADVDTLAEERLGNGQVVTHEASAVLAGKVSRAISMFPLACVATYQVDMDDYEGECGQPFARLGLVRRAQENPTMDDSSQRHSASVPPRREAARELAVLSGTDSERRRRCLSPGKEFTRPLICVLSDRVSTPRNFTKRHCTHIVLSLRRYPRDDAMQNISPGLYQAIRGPDIQVFVALRGDILLNSDAEQLAESTAALLRGAQLDGLAFLYVSQSVLQLGKLCLRLQTLYVSLKASGLCLLLGLQLSEHITRPRILDKVLRDVSKNVDILVLNSHYPGGPSTCRAMHASVFQQVTDSCVPVVAVETALSWLKFVASTSIDVPFLCFSVDLRVFRYSGRTPQGVCDSEEQLEYSEVCSDTGWSTVYNVTTDSLMRRNESMLETFDTASSLRRKVEAATVQYPKVCVAAYNYDFDDLAGHCKDQRLSALRSALDQTTLSASQTMLEHKEPVSTHGDSSGVKDRPLVCILSQETRVAPTVPHGLCTHLVHREAYYDAVAGTLRVKESLLGLMAHRPAMKHVVGLSSETFLSTLLSSRPSVVDTTAMNLAVSARRLRFDGVAILDFNRTSQTITSSVPVLSALRRALSEDLVLILGLEVLDGSLPTKTMTKRLSRVTELADITILQTHYRSNRGYCQISYPSVYEYREGSILPLVTALDWMKDLGLVHTCISFNMALLEFDRLNSTGDCQKVSSRSFSEMCNDSGWKRDDEASQSFSAVRQKGSAWQSFESAELLGQKMDRALAHYPDACVAAFNIDLEDASQACEAHGRKFSRLATIVERYTKSDTTINLAYQQLPPIAEGAASFTSAKLVGSPALRSHGDSTRPANAEPATTYQHKTSKGTSRPFICFMSHEWRDPERPPPSVCTHVVLTQEPTQAKESLDRLKLEQRQGIRYLLALEEILSLNKTQLLSDARGFHGVATINNRIYSSALEGFGSTLANLRNILPEEHTLVAALEIADFHRNADLITKRLEHVQKYADIVVLQTHFRRDESFCRTAHPSAYQSSNEACVHTPPIATALHWMQHTSFQSTCISFNLAALQFNLAEGPGVGKLCHGVDEVHDLCDTIEWRKSEDEQYAMAASRHLDDTWISYETKRLLQRKIRRAMSDYPKLCVAAFNVDFDGSSVCHEREYGRVDAMAAAAQLYAPLADKNFKRIRRLILCVCTASDEPEDIPPEFCDYYIYGFISYISEGVHIFPEDESLHMMKRFRRPGVKIVGAILPKLFSTFIRDINVKEKSHVLFTRLVAFLYEYNLDGIGTVYYYVDVQGLREFSRLVHQLGCMMHSAGFEVVLGISLTDMESQPHVDVTNALLPVARAADILILESHSGYHYDHANCTIDFPSQMEYSANPRLASSNSMRRVHHHIVELAKLVRTPICISFSMGIRSYRSEGLTASIGARCEEFQYENYTTICVDRDGWEGAIVNEKAQSTWRIHGPKAQTYDTRRDIDYKVYHSPSKCVAVYEVELDDPYGICRIERYYKWIPPITTNKTRLFSFPRVAYIHGRHEKLFRGEVRDTNWEAIFETPAEIEPVLICTVTDRKLSMRFPICTYLVYYGARYVGGEVAFEDISSNSAMVHFLGQNDNSRRLISLVQPSHSWYREIEEDVRPMAEFLESTSGFLLKRGLRGVAILRLRMYSGDAHEIKGFLEKLRCHYSIRGLMVVLGVSLMNDNSPNLLNELTLLSREVDMFIVETHLELFSKDKKMNCLARFPSSMYGRFDVGGSVPIKLATEWMAAMPKPQPMLCYSLTLGAYKFSSVSTVKEINDPCSEMKMVDFGETCDSKRHTTRISHVAISSFERAGGRLYSFDSKSDLMLKVDTAGTRCVAAYDADYDDSGAACGMPFFRMHVINFTLGGVAEKRKVEEHIPRRANVTRGPQHTTVCIFSEAATNIRHVPFYACDYIIIPQFSVDLEYTSLKWTTNSGLMRQVEQFSKDVPSTFIMMMTVDSLLALYMTGKPMEDFLKEVVVFMTAKGFKGVAFSYSSNSTLDFESDAVIVQKVREAMISEDKLKYEIMIVVPFNINWTIWSQNVMLSYVDFIIFITHHDKPEVPCRIKYSSSFNATGYIISSAAEAAVLMASLQRTETGPKPPRMCFSLSFAVLSFRTNLSYANVGDQCTRTTQVGYSATCPTKQYPEYTSDDAVSAYRRGRNQFFTYENEETVSMKVLAMFGVLPSVCVATFHSEMEDYGEVCKERPLASRLRAIRATLSVPENVPLRERFQNPLLCTVGKAPRMPPHFRASYCDILIYTDVEFDREHRIMKPLYNRTTFYNILTYHNYTLGRKNRTKVMVSLSPEYLDTPELAVRWKMEDFAAEIAQWINWTRTDGLAIFGDVITRERLKRHTLFMETLRASFFKDSKTIILVYGASIASGFTGWVRSHIATFVDVMVLIAHRNTWKNALCEKQMISDFTGEDEGTLPQKLRGLVKGLEHVVPVVPATAVSLNLAVRQFHGDESRPMFACQYEEWANYSVKCAGNINKDGSFSGVFQNIHTGLFSSFEDENTIQAKVRHFSEWVKGMGVALFNADYEIPNSPCPLIGRGGYTRLRMAYETTMRNKGLNPDVPDVPTPVEPEPAARPDRLSDNGMACIFGRDTNRLPETFPKQMCDFIILMSLTYDGPQSTIMSVTNTNVLNKFLRYQMDLNTTPYYLVGFHRESFSGRRVANPQDYVHFAVRVKNFMNSHGRNLHGILMEYWILVGEDANHFSSIILQTRRHMEDLRQEKLFKVALAAVIPLTMRKWEDVMYVTFLADLMIMLSHRSNPAVEGCRVVTPSTHLYSSRGLAIWSWTLDVMIAMTNIAGGRHLPPMCFSVNMAVLKFSVPNTTRTFGEYCKREEWTDYGKVCPREGSTSYVSSSNMCAYRLENGTFYAFENEDTISVKAISGSRIFPKLCVAAYNMEFENPSVCYGRHPFMRTRALRKALNSLLPTVGNLFASYDFDPFDPSPLPVANRTVRRSTYTYGEYSYKKKKRRTAYSDRRFNPNYVPLDRRERPTPTVCHFNAPAPGHSFVAKTLCSYTVYEAPDYDDMRATFSSEDGTWESALAAARDDKVNLLLGIDAHSLMSIYYEGSSAFAAFLISIVKLANTASSFLGVCVSVFQKMGSLSAEHFLGLIDELRTSLDSVNMTLMYVVSPAAMGDVELRDTVVSTADLIVYAGNIGAGGNSTEDSIVFPDGDGPTSMTSMDGLLELSEKFNDKLSLCVSLNLAVYNCTDKFCAKAGYSETCEMLGTLDRDYSTMTSMVGHSMFIYDDEETLSSKMRDFQQQYPKACVALLNADAEDYSHKCSRRKPFSRLARVRSILDEGGNISPAATPATSSTPSTEPPLQGTTLSSESKVPRLEATLVCLSRPNATVDDLAHVPADICDYVVYPPGSYEYRQRTIEAVKPIDKHRRSRLVLTLAWSTYVDDWVLNVTELMAFTGVLKDFVRKGHWSAFGIFLENPEHVSKVVVIQGAILKMLTIKKSSGFEMVVGSVPLADESAYQSLVLGADLFILMTQHILGTRCTIEPPTWTPAWRSFITDHGQNSFFSLVRQWRASNQPHVLICAPINLAVITYKIVNAASTSMGDDCLSESSENYAQTCNKPAITKASALYYSNKTHLMAFESEETVIIRMEEYHDSIADPCVAVFSADCEDRTGLCTQPFSRLRAIREELYTYRVTTPILQTPGVPSTMSSLRTSNETIGVTSISTGQASSTSTASSTSRGIVTMRGSTSRPSVFNTLLCFISPPFTLFRNFPEVACDVVVYEAVCLQGSGDTQIKGDNWETFLKLRAKLQKRDKKGKFAANLDIECLLDAANANKDVVKAVAMGAVSMLVAYGLSAGAIVVQDSRQEPLIPWMNVMQQYRSAVAAHDIQATLIFGASPAYFSKKSVLDMVLQNVDILVYVNHHTIVRDKPCTVSYPSGVFFEDQADQAVENMNRQKDKAICKSVNMAVFRFALEVLNDTFGSPCRQEVMDSYGEVCPEPRIGAEGEPSWYPVHYKDRFNLISYESEMSLREKVLALRQLVTHACIAAFHVEYEASTGECAHRSSFSRIKEMRHALDDPVDYVPQDVPDVETGTKGAVSVTSTAGGHRRHAKEPDEQVSVHLVCFVSAPLKTPQDYPAYMCDYLVYQSFRYDISSKRMSPSDEGSWTMMLKLRRPPTTKLVVSIDCQSVISATRVDVVDTFTNEIAMWLQKHQLGGVGVLFDLPEDASFAYSTLKALREQLDHVRQGSYVLLLGAAATLPVHLVELAHTFVFLTNHVPSTTTSCTVSYPSVTTRMSTLSEPLLLARGLKEGAGNVSVCLSINLAVLVFWQEAEDQKIGAKCKRGAETDYAELCKQAEIKITSDKEWMSAYLHADGNHTLYTFETEDMLATKVRFYKSWFPDVCIAAFHTERDIYAHPCPLLPPYSRLIKIGDTLFTASS